jgi:hypothetical protein
MSGYINRLQSLASSWILAEQVGAEFSACWVPFEFVPGPTTDTFSSDFCARYLVSEDHVRDTYGITVSEIPRYVSQGATGGWVGLRGHDRGEQALLPELVDLINGQETIPLLVIVAGGTFHLGDPSDRVASTAFLQAKRDFYRGLPLHEGIESAVARELESDPRPYIGLHLRYSDRSHQAPLPRAIVTALRDASESSGIGRVFIASDTGAQLSEWHERVRDMGLEPWSVTHETIDRRDPRSGHAALIDWRLLGNSERLVYFAESSYATEAAVAAGAWESSIALRGHPLQAVGVRMRGHVTSGGNWLKRLFD